MSKKYDFFMQFHALQTFGASFAIFALSFYD